jgi:hypothetical protein
MAEQELAVIQKTYDFIKWSSGPISKFPRSHRFVFGERMERRLYDLLSHGPPRFVVLVYLSRHGFDLLLREVR